MEEMKQVDKQAIKLAMQKFREEYGDDARLEDGDEFAAVFNDCVLVLSLEGSRLGIKFLIGKPYRVDMTLGAYESSG